MRSFLQAVTRPRSMRPVQARFASQPAWVKDSYVQIFNSDFDNASYPEKAVGGDHLTFSKLAFQLAVAEKQEAQYLKDIQNLLRMSETGELGVFWRTESNIAEDPKFSSLAPGLKFVLRWMQTSNAMDTLEDVAKILGIYLKAKEKTLVATVTLAGLPESQATQISAAKKAVNEIISKNLASKKEWSVEYTYLVDPGLIDGFRVEVGGYVAEELSAYLKARSTAADALATSDYTSGPVSKSLPTVWPQTPETELLSDWCEELSLYDDEEARHGF